MPGFPGPLPQSAPLRDSSGRLLLLTGDELDTDHVYGPLWIGSQAKRGRALFEAGFTMLVLCSANWQPRSFEVPGVFVLHAPFEDRHPAPASRDDLNTAWNTATAIANFVHENPAARVLVTCMAGLNRSGLVVALALHQLYGWDSEQCLHVLRAHRPGAMFNRDFVRYLEWIAPPRRRR